MVLVPALLLLVFTSQQTDAYNLPKYLILALAACYGAYKRLPGTLLDLPIVVYLLVLALCAVLGENPWRSVLGLYMSYSTALLPALCLAAVYYASVGVNRDQLCCWTMVGVVLTCIYGLAQATGAAWATPYDLLSGNRIYSTVGGPVFLAGALAMLAPLFVRASLPAFLGLVAVVIWLTMARVGLVAFALAVGWMLKDNLSKRALVMLAAFGIIGGAIIISGRPYLAKSDVGRAILVRVSLSAFEKSPITGIGPELLGRHLAETRTKDIDEKMGQSWSNSYSHNLFLEALSGTGIIGFGTLLWLLLAVFHAVRRDQLMFAMSLGLFAYAFFQPVPLSMKGIYAVFLGASQRPRGELWPPVLWTLRLSVPLALVFTVFLTASFRLYLQGATRKNAVLAAESTRLIPGFYR
jgi:hypothetical protein